MAFKFEIVKRIAALSDEKNGMTKELNLVSYNDAPPKYDLRSWDAEHQRMSKGITLSDEEMIALKEAIATLDL